MKHIAILDIGKTNAKLVVLDASSGEEIASQRMPNAVVHSAPYPHYDIEALWQFFLKSLASFAQDPGFDSISITTHGASAVLVREDGNLALPMLDYEFNFTEEIRSEYEAIKPDFRESFSPSLSHGLNLGLQLYFLSKTFPAEFAQAKLLLTYPQYWAWRLTGCAATEITSLGCHTDLWLPKSAKFSSLVDRLNIRDKIPPLRSAFDTLGLVLPEIAAKIGLEKPVPVHCGIHDSNASLLPHLMSRKQPFSVVSSGTWIVSFAVGGDLDRLDPKRDMLANIDAYGKAIPSARYMGGREFELMTEGFRPQLPTDADLAQLISQVIEKRIMAMPSAVPGCGPYPNSHLRWLNSSPASQSELYVAASLYAALMTRTCLQLLRSSGPIIVEGPFAANPVYTQALANFSRKSVEAIRGSTGTSLGAGLLAGAHLPTITGKIYQGESSLYAEYEREWLKNTASLL